MNPDGILLNSFSTLHPFFSSTELRGFLLSYLSLFLSLLSYLFYGIRAMMAQNESSNVNDIQNQSSNENNQNQAPNTIVEQADPSQLNSPFFIGANENSGVLLVTQMLDSSNYHSWARSMKRALRIKNKLGFIDGSICEPADAAL